MNIVAIGAHPDDVELFCAGTLAKYVAGGHRVTIIVVCDGSAGLRRFSFEEARRVREQESREAASIMGAEIVHFAYPDHMIPMEKEVRLRITDLLRKVRANIVITHDPNDCYLDHTRTSSLVEDAIYHVTQDRVETEHAPSPIHPALIYMDTMAGLSFHPTSYVDITEVMDDKIRMIQCYRSQLDPGPQFPGDPSIMEMMVISARFRGLQCGVRYAEGFRVAHKWDRTFSRRILP